MQNFFVPSAESLRHTYLMECFVANSVPTLLVGPRGSGTSTYMRDHVFAKLFEYTSKLGVDHLTLNSHTDS
jgi:hypothetical protein